MNNDSFACVQLERIQRLQTHSLSSHKRCRRRRRLHNHQSHLSHMYTPQLQLHPNGKKNEILLYFNLQWRFSMEMLIKCRRQLMSPCIHICLALIYIYISVHMTFYFVMHIINSQSKSYYKYKWCDTVVRRDDGINIPNALRNEWNRGMAEFMWTWEWEYVDIKSEYLRIEYSI